MYAIKVIMALNASVYHTVYISLCVDKITPDAQEVPAENIAYIIFQIMHSRSNEIVNGNSLFHWGKYIVVIILGKRRLWKGLSS